MDLGEVQYLSFDELEELLDTVLGYMEAKK
jgi:hypothetical protein